MAILSFDKDYYFLSNFYPVEFVWGDITWKHSEGAYQAAKCLHRDDQLIISKIDNPSTVKLMVRKMKLVDGWSERKIGVMYDVVKAKFTQSDVLRARLIDTGDQHLEEGNWWNDTFWGVCPIGSSCGENHLGKILMRVREELR